PWEECSPAQRSAGPREERGRDRVQVVTDGVGFGRVLSGAGGADEDRSNPAPVRALDVARRVADGHGLGGRPSARPRARQLEQLGSLLCLTAERALALGKEARES